jgi:TRAP-type C4-dicarboxylate transport system permease small subunit
MPVGITYMPLPVGSLLTLVFVLEKSSSSARSTTARWWCSTMWSRKSPEAA